MIILRAYATIPELINDLLGWNLPILPVYSFGFFVAVGFIGAAMLLSAELKRREQLGLLQGYVQKVWEGKAPGFSEVLINAVIGFLLGYKLIGAVLDYDNFIADPRTWVFSNDGSLIAGIVVAAVYAGFRYYTKLKKKLENPVLKEKVIFPHQMVGDMVAIAAIFGVLGSNVFNFFEAPGNFEQFLKDPLGSLFSGLTIYGGLVFGGLGLLIFSRKRNIKIPHLFDALAPAFTLAYGIGRIGCHVSGDGDWGIENHLDKPGWIPEFLWRNDYAHNIINAGERIPDCVGENCYQLANPVFPTPLYELMMSLVICLILWSLRKKLTKIPGILFTVFMIFNGTERFFIEKIRVNEKLNLLGMKLTQAEIIAFSLVLIGVGLTAFLYMNSRKRLKKKLEEEQTVEL